jgi:hypothetical protein
MGTSEQEEVDYYTDTDCNEQYYNADDDEHGIRRDI